MRRAWFFEIVVGDWGVGCIEMNAFDLTISEVMYG